MNITLSASPETIRVVREWAKKENTSLNQYIRDCLDRKAKELEEQHKRECAKFRKFLRSLKGSLPADYKFSREDANFRDMKCLREA